MNRPWTTCALCPRLCRHACPVATGSAREAAVPSQIADVLLAWERGLVDEGVARQAASLCVDCDRCQEACHLDVPLSGNLRTLRSGWRPASGTPQTPTIEGDAAWVAVLHDDRGWGRALADRVGRPVATLQTDDALGFAWRGSSVWERQLRVLDDLLCDRVMVVAHGAVAAVLRDVDVEVRWLHAVTDTPSPAALSCQCGGPVQSCCGGAEPLRSHHPGTASSMARQWPSDQVVDSRCADHLRAEGRASVDAIDRLLGMT